jgi:hypothetical protein
MAAAAAATAAHAAHAAADAPQQDDPCSWADLPGEALQLVLLAAGAGAGVACCVCRAWRAAGESAPLWRQLYARRWGEPLPPLPLPPLPCDAGAWRAAFGARATLPRAVRAALADVAAPVRRAPALARLLALDAALPPGVLLDALQATARDDAGATASARDAASRAVSELAIATLARVGAARATPQTEPALLLDAALAVALLVEPRADVVAARRAVARLGAAAAARLAQQGLGGADAPPSERVRALNAFLFARPAGAPPPAPHADDAVSALPSLLLPEEGEAMPSAGGCDFSGARGPAYAAPAASSLVSLLATRRGLPITLAVLHVAVGAAAGVRVRPCGIPRQFMTRTDPVAASSSSGGAEQQQQQPLFFDVFERAAARSAAQVLSLIGTFGIVPSDAWLAPTPPRDVAARMCRNLLSATGAAAAALRPGAQLVLLTAQLALLPRRERRDADALTLRVQRLRYSALAGEVALALEDYDEIAAAHAALAGEMSAEVEGVMRGMLAAARAAAQAPGEQADADADAAAW